MLGAKVLDEIEDLIEDQSVGTLFPLGHLNLSKSLMLCISTFLPKPYTCIHYSFPHMLPLLIISSTYLITTYLIIHLSYHPLIIHHLSYHHLSYHSLIISFTYHIIHLSYHTLITTTTLHMHIHPHAPIIIHSSLMHMHLP